MEMSAAADADPSASGALSPRRRDRVLVFIPMYNCAPQISRTLAQLRDPAVAAVIDGVACFDNRSSDGTAEAAMAAMDRLSLPLRCVLRNDDNYGLGGSHKAAIDFGRARGFSHLVVLHGDDQGAIGDAVPHLAAGAHLEVDFLMGARFMKGSRLEGYSPLRTVANHVFNLIFSAVARRRIHDLGSGLNVFRLSAFDGDWHQRYADDLTFNYHLILGLPALGKSVRFFPLTWREDDQVSNARLFRMGIKMLRLLALRLRSRRAFLEGEHRDVVRPAYTSSLLMERRD